jgi:hypothetical protein
MRQRQVETYEHWARLYRLGSIETIAALQTFATTQDPAGGGYELIASTPTSRTEPASLRLGAVD